MHSKKIALLNITNAFIFRLYSIRLAHCLFRIHKYILQVMPWALPSLQPNHHHHLQLPPSDQQRHRLHLFPPAAADDLLSKPGSQWTHCHIVCSVVHAWCRIVYVLKLFIVFFFFFWFCFVFWWNSVVVVCCCAQLSLWLSALCRSVGWWLTSKAFIN